MQQFRVYKSSAGSGKTTTLVNEYLRLCIPNPDKFRNVIALTFTIKATNEMKQRVVETLNHLSNVELEHPDSKTQFVLNFLLENTKLKAEEIKRNASILLNRIVHNYSEFAFSTLDSFVVRIVKSFSHELNLPSAFELELDKNILIDQAVEMLYNQIGSNTNLTEYMIEYVLQQVDEEENHNVENALKQLSQLLFESANTLELKKLDVLKLEDFKVSVKILDEEIKKLEHFIKKTGEDGLQIFENLGLTSKDFYQTTKGIYNFFVKLALLKFENVFNSYVNKALEDNLWYSDKLEISKKNAIDSISNSLTEVAFEIQKRIPILISYKLLRKKMVPLALLTEIKQLINTITNEEGIVHLSEMNSRISEVVMNEPIPFIYERIGRKYQHFLVDEFQDTSVIQWNNLNPLIENNLSSGQFNMVVGDAKQAIYRWRDGDVEQFVDLPNLKNSEKILISQDRQKVFQIHYDEKNLNHNFRSSPVIVNFNNQFFENYLQNVSDRNRTIYDEHQQISGQKTKKGYIKVELLEDSTKDKKVFLEAVLENVHQAIDNGFKPNDIAILSRKNNVIGEIADYLSLNGYKVVTANALSLKESPNVRFVIDFFNWLNSLSNRIYLSNIIYFLKNNLNISISIEEIYRLLRLNNLEFELSLQEFGFNIDTRKLLNLSAYDLAEFLMREFGINHQADQFLATFLDTLATFTTSNGTSISEYLELWEKKFANQTIKSTSATDAISLMSFHRAKGLEFPVVINALFGLKQSTNKNEYFWVDTEGFKIPVGIGLIKKANEVLESQFSSLQEKEIIHNELDLLNLLYVAFTRPEIESRIIVDKKSSDIKIMVKVLESMVLLNDFHACGENSFETEIPEYNFLKIEERTDNDDLVLSTLESIDWKEIMSLRTKYDESEQQKNRREMGNLVHLILSELDDLDKIELTIDDLCSKENIGKEEKEVLKKLLLPLKMQTQLKGFFSENNPAKKESSILLPDGKQLRPDRVVFTEKEILILDYKVSDFSAVSDKILEKYKSQLDEYKSIIKDIHNMNVSTWLLFIGEKIELIAI